MITQQGDHEPATLMIGRVQLFSQFKLLLLCCCISDSSAFSCPSWSTSGLSFLLHLSHPFRPFPPSRSLLSRPPFYPNSYLMAPVSPSLSHPPFSICHLIFRLHRSLLSVCLSVRVSLPRSLSLSSAINFPDWLPDSRAADEPYSFPGLTLSTCPG